jgi:poly(hydroxyalkanoate) depolymerase family esterase
MLNDLPTPWTEATCLKRGSRFESADAARRHTIGRGSRGETPVAAPADPGDFSAGSYTHAGLTRSYKLYAPGGAAGRSLPLVVMLHGCAQDPDDFAAGTAMNEQARAQGFLVLYPAQSNDANPARCWNWFKLDHQQRDGGEPAMIAAMTRAVMQEQGVDPRRVYIAGLSAGGAMAAIVAAAYPEIFAAVGVHSGLPLGAVSDVAGALALMRSGHADPGPTFRVALGTAARPQRAVPTIVFHGDQDQTVHLRNGEQVIAAVLGSAAAARARSALRPDAGPQVEQGVSVRGRAYTRFTHRGDQGLPLAEHWLLHGSGHAWSGGRSAGSYTDAKGPDATCEMIRFFFAQPAA